MMQSEVPNARHTATGCLIFALLALGLVLSQLAVPPPPLPRGLARGALQLAAPRAEFPLAQPTTGVPVLVYDLATLQLYTGPPATVSRLLPRLSGPPGSPSYPGTSLHAAPAPDAQAAYVLGRRLIVVAPDGAARTYRLPRVGKVHSLQWSPDGRMILYHYAHGTFRQGFSASVTEIYGLGLLDLQTQRHYRVLPCDTASGRLTGVRGPLSVRWVPSISTPLPPGARLPRH